jgi:hypothetical protein
MASHWFKNAVIYCIDIDTFKDGNGDGVGDFVGLQQGLSYLAGLGVTCIWLLPFYPSPDRDNGYDITNYLGVHPALGDLGDFAAFMDEANDRGIRVIIDLVVNQTSNEHPGSKQRKNVTPATTTTMSGAQKNRRTLKTRLLSRVSNAEYGSTPLLRRPTTSIDSTTTNRI